MTPPHHGVPSDEEAPVQFAQRAIQKLPEDRDGRLDLAAAIDARVTEIELLFVGLADTTTTRRGACGAGSSWNRPRAT